MQKAAKGETVEGHKYLERHPDGKGGWLYRYLAGHEIDITPHEKLGMRGTLKWKVFDSDDTHASVGFHATVPGYGHKISHDALAMYKDDLEGRVVSDKKSGDPDIDAVTGGTAEFLGKGDDGLVFKSGDNVVKVSTVVPYQPSNPWYKTAQKAVEVAREQHETQQALRDAGVPGLLPERFVEHDGRGYTIKRYLGIPDKLTLEQLDAAHDTVLAMHKAGYVLGDTPQIGVDDDGKAFMFDVGKAGKAEPYDGYRHLSPQQSDLDGLESLYARNGQRYTPRGANLEYEWEAQLRHVLKFPPKQDAQRDKFALELIDMSHALRKDADAFGKLVIDQDLAEALKKLERPEQVDVAKLLEDAPAAVHAELPQAAARAVKAGARAGTLSLLGAGAEGIVFTDGASAYKVGRRGVSSRKHEANALEVLSKDPRTKDLVPSFEKYDADTDTLVRAEVEGRPGGWGSKGLWEAHQTIAKVLREHEFTAPEFKENSFVIEGDKPKMIDIGYVQPIGKRAAAELNTKIKGLRAIDFQIEPHLALDLSLDLFATFDEGAMSLDQLREHVAKVRELAPTRQFSDLQFEDRLKQRERTDISPLHIDAVKSILKEYAPEFHTIGLRIVDDADPPEVGSILAESRRWEDGEPTDDVLDGTSAIDLGSRDGSDVSRALDHAKAYQGKYALLLGSQSSEEGEDTDRFGRPIERVMRKPEVLARFKLKKSEGSERPGHKYIRREPDGKGGHNYFYEDSKGVRTPAAQNTYGVAPDLGMAPAHKKKIAALAASMKGISHTDDAFADHSDESHVRNAWRNEWMTKTTPQLALIGKIARGRASADEKRTFAEAVTRASRISKKEIDDCEAMAIRQYAATQALFAAKGERTVRIHRGIAHDQGKALVEQAKQAQGGTVPVAVRSLSSWTSDHESAHDFGTQYATRGAVVTLDVPVEAVLFHAEHEADLGAYEGEEETLVMARDDLQVPAAAIQEAQGELGDPDPDAFKRHRISLPHETEKVEAEREARREAEKKSAKAAEKQKQAEWEAGAPAREAAAQAEREAAQAKRAAQDKVAAEQQQKLEIEQYHASKLPKAEREKMAKELLAKPGVIPSIGQLDRHWRLWLGVDMKGNATRDDGDAPAVHPDTYAAVKARAEGTEKSMHIIPWGEAIRKAREGSEGERPGHKYIRRTPDGKGGWRYGYDLPGHPSDRPPRKPAGEVRLTRPQLDDLLEHGTYSIISAGRNGNDAREKDMPEDHAEFKARHERLRGELKKRKLRYTEVEGHYGSREASFIVHHESAKPQKSNAFMVHHDSLSEFGVMRALGKQFNQDSVIHSHRGAHEMHFTTGGHAGEHHKGKGYEYKPAAEDFYTRVETPGRPSKFALDLDWDKRHAFQDAVLKALLVLEKARKLHRRRDFRGLQVSVENQSGSIRHWYDSHAKRAGKTKMVHDYGYIRRTQGTDGDHVDVYVGPDKMAPYVFVIDQLKSPDFVHVDEQKCMLGFSNLGAAVQAYQAHYDDPRFLGQVRAVAFEDFAAFVTDPSNHGALVKSYVVQRYSPSQEPPDFEGIYGTVQTEKEVKASRRRRKALARRNSGKYAFHGAAPQKPSIRFNVREWATIRDAVETGKR